MRVQSPHRISTEKSFHVALKILTISIINTPELLLHGFEITRFKEEETIVFKKSIIILQ